MRYLAVIVFLSACTGQNSPSLQAEYDSLVKSIGYQKSVIEINRNITTEYKSLAEERRVQLIRMTDSLEADLKNLEKRKQELAAKLYNK